MKKNYEDEVITVMKNILLSIIDCGCIYALYEIFEQYINREFNFGIFLIAGGLCLICIILLSGFVYLNIHNVRYNNKITKDIITNGVKIHGKIIDVIKVENANKKNTPSTYFKNSYFNNFVYTTSTDERRERVIFYAIVEYSYKGKIYTINSPSLNFHPDYLTDNNVDVYLYDDKYYIDNYKIDVYKLEKNKKDYKNINISVIIMFFVAVIASYVVFYLRITNVITSRLAFTLYKVLWSLYCIITLIVFTKYVFNKLNKK